MTTPTKPDAPSVHELMDRTFLTGELFDYVRSHGQMRFCPVEVRNKAADVDRELGNLYALLTQLMPLQKETEGAAALRSELKKEKDRRIYYQDIVYNVCNQLDKALGRHTLCGTADAPSTIVQDSLAMLLRQMAEEKQANEEMRVVLADFKTKLRGFALELS